MSQEIELEIEFEDEGSNTNENAPIPAAIMEKLNKVRNATIENTMEESQGFAQNLAKQEEIEEQTLPAKFDGFTQHSSYISHLMLDDVALNAATSYTKKYYIMKILKNVENVRGLPKYILALKWGKMNDKISTVVHWEEFSNAEDAEKAFKIKFSEKTFSSWEDRENFSHVDGGYRLVTEADISGTGGNIFQRLKNARNFNSGAMEEETQALAEENAKE
jgi:predicted DNA-binding WGR domain protein